MATAVAELAVAHTLVLVAPREPRRVALVRSQHVHPVSLAHVGARQRRCARRAQVGHGARLLPRLALERALGELGRLLVAHEVEEAQRTVVSGRQHDFFVVELQHGGRRRVARADAELAA